MTENKVSLPMFFTVLYFADVGTSLIAAMIWGDFPNTSQYMTALINSVLLWIIFKVLAYVIIMIVFNRLSKYSEYAENILIAITVIYGIVLLNHLSSIVIPAPEFTICPEFFSSIEVNENTVIPR